MLQLANQSFLITRATHQAGPLIHAIEKHQGKCFLLPCIEIVTPHSTQSLTHAVENLEHYQFCIFTSANAVNALPQDISLHANVIAIGPGTAAALRQKGIKSRVPQTYNSEGVIELLATSPLTQKKIAIFTGENPRPLLHETLMKHGADVDLIYCYRRQCPHYATHDIDAIVENDIDVIITQSKETLQNLYHLFTHHHDWLLNKKLLVTSVAMSHTAAQLGFSDIMVATSNTIDAILQALE